MPNERGDRGRAPPERAETPASRLLTQPLSVINVGLDGFAHDLALVGAAVQPVAWTPPANGDPVLADLLARLDG